MKFAGLVMVGTAVAMLGSGVEAGAQGQERHADHEEHAARPAALVAAVREATEPFQDPAAAVGYAPILGCVSGQQEGAMGLHLLNGALVFDDGGLNERTPEALMYEMRGGTLHLLGAEFIVPVAAWHTHHAAPPALLGQSFTLVDVPNRFGLGEPFYALHVWAWKENPHGTFVDWNPRVSCDGFSENPN
jgi:hypothetical protein